MKIIKRNGQYQELSFDKVTRRMKDSITNISLRKERQHDVNIDIQLITQKVVNKLSDKVTTFDIDQIIIDTLVDHFADDNLYDDLATQIYISRLHKITSRKFSVAFKKLFDAGIVFEKYWNFVRENKDALNIMINDKNDYKYNYFGIKTVEKVYLHKVDDQIIERPQYMLMRIAIQLYWNSEDPLVNIKECYENFSNFKSTPATPTIRNSCTKNGNLASCYLFHVEDSLKGIMKTLSDQAMCSKVAGGLGMSITDIRSKNSVIGNTGKTDGIIPMLQMYNNMILYVNQQQVRNGSLAVYLEPWHPEIEEFIEIRTIGGDEKKKCRQLFPALWIPDLFYKKLQDKTDWYLLDPVECPGLTDCYGEKFEELYQNYVNEGKYRKILHYYERDNDGNITNSPGSFQKLFQRIVTIRSETGTPYICNKDHVNNKSNQKHIGIIKNSNLCAEICLVSNEVETGVCNLASISLPKHMRFNSEELLEYDFEMLGETTRQLVRNLNNVIDNTQYIREDGDPIIPTEAQKCNFDHRPIGIGIQGLANTFAMLKYPWESDEAVHLNKNIMRTIYYYAMDESMELAKKAGPYPTFNQNDNPSPLAQGKFQFDMWDFDYSDEGMFISNNQYDELRENIMKHGARNSMLTALMPTATSSQILGNNECFDPFHSNLYSRQTLAGNITILNKYLVQDLKFYGLWDENMKKQIMRNGGSIQQIEEIPTKIKQLYKTVYEIPNSHLIRMSADRGPYVDHSQSMNLYYEFGDNDIQSRSQNVARDMILAWKLGLKTGVYYTHSKEAIGNYELNVEDNILACSVDNKDDCLACSA